MGSMTRPAPESRRCSGACNVWIHPADSGFRGSSNWRTLERCQGRRPARRVCEWRSGGQEARLAAPPGLLQWLLEHAEEPPIRRRGGGDLRSSNRRRIVDRDADTLAAALKSLQTRRASPRAWYVLKGQVNRMSIWLPMIRSSSLKGNGRRRHRRLLQTG